LRDDTALRCRLLRSARLLLDWSQARLACESGITTSTVYAVEAGRLSTTSPAGTAMIQALKCEGVVLLSADQGGPGLRYAGPSIDKFRSLPLPEALSATAASRRR
jgi:transcriptional regulator with XRE-family HTH domain